MLDIPVIKFCMKKILIIFTLFSAMLYGCSKKTIPAADTPATGSSTKDSAAAVTTVIKRKPTLAVPKIITVNDAVARKTLDGRLYYDLQGHRYWRNNKDGKYHLFNKAMYNDDAYKPQ